MPMSMPLPRDNIVYRLKGKSLDALTKVTEPIVAPSQDQVLVKVKSVSLNSRDYQVIVGTYPPGSKDELVPGSDMSGEVVAIGDNVTDVKIGDSVISNFRVRDVWDPKIKTEICLGAAVDGVLKEYVLLPQDVVNKISIPSGFSWEEAASLVCTGVTAWNALYGLQPLKAGDYVLLIGTGGAALTALSIAKAAGAVTIITSSSDRKLQDLKSEHKVDYTINYNSTPDWEKEVLRITNNRGVDHIFETGGVGTIEKSIDCVAPQGIISLVGFMAPKPQAYPDVFMKALFHKAILRGVRVGTKAHAQELIKFVETADNFHIRVDKVYKFHKDEVVTALSELATGSTYGKICISYS